MRLFRDEAVFSHIRMRYACYAVHAGPTLSTDLIAATQEITQTSPAAPPRPWTHRILSHGKPHSRSFPPAPGGVVQLLSIPRTPSPPPRPPFAPHAPPLIRR